MTIEPGTKLGPYEVQDLLGQGAMGVVYRAYHSQLERTGAVKVLHGIANDQDSAARFRHEAQAIAQMRHPNVLNVFDFGEYQGTPYMIVEYVPGGSLAARLNQGQVDQATALKFLRGIAAGIDYAHSLGIVHRDVKPANVLLEKDGTPVLADFGLVKLLQGSSMRSLTGVTTGTPAYMAPEQVMGHKVGPPADRYSFATIAYEMLTGVIPFDGEGVMEVLYAQVHRDPPSPSSRNPQLSPQADAVILRGLAKDPDARRDSCVAFVDALAAALNPVPAVAGTVVLKPAATATKPLAPSTGAKAPAPKHVRELTPATVAMAIPIATPQEYGPPSPNGNPSKTHVSKPRRRSLQIAGALAILLLLLLALGVCAVAAQRPTLAVDPRVVAAGDAVLVTGTRVPANQVGEIQLHSVVHVFPFRASAAGVVSEEITVPADTAVGDHIVRLCWDSSCRAQAALRVVVPGTVIPTSSPTPYTSTPTPTGLTSPGPSSRPATSPSATATRSPSPTPKLSPKPSPLPSPSPSTSPACSPVTFSVPTISKLNGFTTTYHCFPIATTWTVTLWSKAPLGSWQSNLRGSATIGAVTYSKTFTLPIGVLVGYSAKVETCRNGVCYTSSTVVVGA